MGLTLTVNCDFLLNEFTNKLLIAYLSVVVVVVVVVVKY